VTRTRKNPARMVVDELASQLRGSLTPGASFEGTLTVDDMDVEITVRVRRAVSRDQAVVHRDAAFELLSTEGWRDRCAASVRDRSPWRSVKGTTQCSKPVTSVVAFKAYDGTIAYSFRCSCHVDDHGRDARSVFATVVLSPPALKVIRARRKADQEAREAFGRMTEVERIAHDAKIERKPVAVVAEILAQKDGVNHG
jgi:hypothetical protein